MSVYQELISRSDLNAWEKNRLNKMRFALKEANLETPPCCPTCGVEIEITTKTKADLKTSVGGWKTYCSRKCSRKHEINADANFNSALSYLSLESPPVCKQCGGEVKFVSQHHIKDDLRKTPFGGWREFCSVKCMHSNEEIIKKKEETTISRYGYSHWSKDPSSQNREKWDDKKKEAYNKKRKETTNKKYGVDHFSKTTEYIERRKETTNKKYGVDNTFQLVERVRQGTLRKYGVPVAIQSEDVLSKKRSTMILKYGVEHPMQNELIKFKARIGNIKNLPPILWDVKHHIVQNQYEDAKKIFIDIITSLGHSPTRYELAKQLGISYSHTNWLVRYFDLYSMFSYTTGT